MSLFRYLPYWKNVREDLLNTLTGLDDESLGYRAHQRIPSIGELVIELANLCSATVAWLRGAGDAGLRFDPNEQTTRRQRLAALQEAWAELEEFAEGISREELTRQRPLNPDDEQSEYFSFYEAYWEIMRHEIAYLGRIETHLMALKAEQSGEMKFHATTRITRKAAMLDTTTILVDDRLTAPLTATTPDPEKIGEEPAVLGEVEAAPEPPAEATKATEAPATSEDEGVSTEGSGDDDDPLSRLASGGNVDDDDDLSRLMGGP